MVVVGGTVVVGGLVVVGGTVVVGGLVVVGGTVVVGVSVVVGGALVVGVVAEVDGAVVAGWDEVVVAATVVVEDSVAVPVLVAGATASALVEVVVDGVDAVSAAPEQAPASTARASRPGAERFRIASCAFAASAVPLHPRWLWQPAGRCRGPTGLRPGPHGSWRCGMDRFRSRPR